MLRAGPKPQVTKGVNWHDMEEAARILSEDYVFPQQHVFSLYNNFLVGEYGLRCVR